MISFFKLDSLPKLWNTKVNSKQREKILDYLEIKYFYQKSINKNTLITSIV